MRIHIILNLPLEELSILRLEVLHHDCIRACEFKL